MVHTGPASVTCIMRLCVCVRVWPSSSAVNRVLAVSRTAKKMFLLSPSGLRPENIVASSGTTPLKGLHPMCPQPSFERRKKRTYVHYILPMFVRNDSPRCFHPSDRQGREERGGGGDHNLFCVTSLGFCKEI